MKFLSVYKFKSGAVGDAARKFLESGAPAPEGATLLGRWHNADLSGGFSLIETDDPKASYDLAVQWADIIDIQSHAVLEDADIGPILAKYYGS